MGIILGIDVGGSTTKIVGIQNNECIGMLQVRAADQITSMYGAVGNFLAKHKIALESISEIYLTGVGASFIDEQVYGIKTNRVNELTAIGHGALRLAGLSEALVVSMGTGTAFVKATREEVTHLGGSGVGGGTIIGLASQMLGKNDIDAILALAKSGSLKNVDLFVSDILKNEVQSLPSELTAANFGKIKSTASESDIALGIINMIFETVGMLAVFALKNDDLKDVILTGTLATFPQARMVFSKFEKLIGLNFIIPDDAVYATALGATEY
ncbi:MAG: type II pantothenate kinase [Oscillospiraceae bacterium]|nr:type II pantothenate kinase [Oscillospiraceae bacterium]